MIPYKTLIPNLIYHHKFPISRIKDKLNKYYRIFITKETSDSLNCLIIRRWRLCGIPWIGPHTRLNVKIIEENEKFKISYRFFWPEYILYWVISLIIGITIVLSGSEPMNGFGILRIFFIFIAWVLLFSIIVFIDTKIFYHRFKMISEKF